MRLVLQLVTRLLLVVVLCLAAATVWATVDAHRSVDRATAASAQRVSQTLEALYWRELLLRSNRTREQLLPVPDWRSIEAMKLISPGICVEIEPRGAFEQPLCGQSKGIGKPAPLWFAAAAQNFLGHHTAVSRPISVHATTAGTVSAIADPDAAIGLAWEYIQNIINVALLMAIAIALLASLAIAHTIAPARSIVAALQRMAHGHYRTSLPRFQSMELSMIGRVAQECLTNALRHGAARETWLRIERRSGRESALLIRVEDDGGGDMVSVAQSAGFGLTGIRERVAAVGGSLSIARASRGLSVAATIPMAA